MTPQHWVTHRYLEPFQIQDIMDSKAPKSDIFWGPKYIACNCFEQGYWLLNHRENRAGLWVWGGRRTAEEATGKRLADLVLTLLIVTICDSLL